MVPVVSTTSYRLTGPGTRQLRGLAHWRGLLALSLLVLLAHLWLTHEVVQQMKDLAPAAPSIQRMEATYVSEVKLTAPPVVAAAPPAAPKSTAPTEPKRRKPKPPLKAASAPQEEASAPQIAEAASAPVADAASAVAAEPAVAAASTPEVPVPPETASAPANAASSATATALSAPRKGPSFVWPKATRVNYKLEGNYRGPFYGSAYVEWVRQGNQYQVHFEASVPLLGAMRMSSEGDIVAQGLSPRRYESINRMLFKTFKPAQLLFEENEVVLANGQREPRAADMQDPVSQLIHLAYRFMLDPKMLKAGNTIEIPIAWTKKVETLAYDVIAEEDISTAIGQIPSLHVKPRRIIKDKDNLSGEIWFAPGLQYLPVRIFTRWSDEIYLDMQMDGAPRQTPGDENEAGQPAPAKGSSSAGAGSPQGDGAAGNGKAAAP
jgi:Protein of unknown function (DUF3108)